MHDGAVRPSVGVVEDVRAAGAVERTGLFPQSECLSAGRQRYLRTQGLPVPLEADRGHPSKNRGRPF